MKPYSGFAFYLFALALLIMGHKSKDKFNTTYKRAEKLMLTLYQKITAINITYEPYYPLPASKDKSPLAYVIITDHVSF